MRSSLFVVAFAIIACGGSSRDLEGSRGRGSNGGGSGSESGGGGGTGGTDRAGGSAGTAGVATGANGGTGARGGSAGVSGDAGEPSGGVGNAGTGAIGGTAGTDSSGGTAGAGAMPSITTCSESFRFLGVWEGNVLDFYFEPIESIRLVITPDEELGGYQGTLSVGSGDPPPPVTTGDEPYPNLEFWDTGGAGRGSGIEPWPGYAHTVVRGAACDDIFRVSISAAEPWDAWCALQEPVYTPDYGWGCTYRGGGSSGGGMCQVQDNGGQPLGDYPLWKCEMCGAFSLEGGVCACDEAGCSYNRAATDVFQLEWVDDGILSGPDPRCGDCTVRLTRVE